jgi:hypothetical protein
VNQRRKFIDEKDGIKSRTNFITPPAEIPMALSMAVDAASQSAKAADTK